MAKSNLSAFLNPQKQEDLHVVVSDRFKDEDGNPIEFIVTAITAQENEAILAKCRKTVNGKLTDKTDNALYQKKLVTRCTVYPDFNDAAFCKELGVVSPYEAASKMLMLGEYQQLVKAILKVNHIKTSEEIEEEAKN